MYKGIDLISLFRLFDLNSLSYLAPIIKFFKKNYLFKSKGQVNRKKYKYADSNLFELKVLLEAIAKAKIPNFNLKISKHLNNNSDAETSDSGPYVFDSALNKQEIEYSLINITLPSVIRAEGVTKDRQPEFNHPIDDILFEDLKDDTTYESAQESIEGDDKLENIAYLTKDSTFFST